MSEKLAAAAQQPDPEALLRLSDVLKIVPVSRMYVFNGVAKGTFPQPIKLSERVTAWRRRDILSWIDERAAASRAAS